MLVTKLKMQSSPYGESVIFFLSLHKHTTLRKIKEEEKGKKQTSAKFRCNLLRCRTLSAAFLFIHVYFLGEHLNAGTHTGGDAVFWVQKVRNERNSELNSSFSTALMWLGLSARC